MHLGDDPPTLKPPTRVEVYATGLGTGFDMTSAEYFLEKGKPQCVVTNSSEISDLLSVLQKSNSEQKIYNIFKTQGYEFHLFLFQDQDKTVMHLRVFEPVENKRHLLAISAESTAKSVVYNDQIGQWLHARVKAENKIIERQ